MPDLIKSVVTKEHPVYTRRKRDWERDERRYRGGRHVWTDLIPFQWEDPTPLGDVASGITGEEVLQDAIERLLRTSTLTHYQRRQEQATYINFPRRMAEKFVGRLAAEAPEPGSGYQFGPLGAVSKPGAPRNPLVRAEMLWTNCDLRGTSFTAWMNDVQRWAMVTGHRWVGVTAPRRAPQSLADEAAGRRPYFVHYSPLDVPNWDFGDDGKLSYLVIRLRSRRLVTGEGEYDGTERHLRLLYVRRGFAAFGAKYARGGWWLFDDDGEPLREGGRDISGSLDQTQGEIPYTPFFYEHDLQETSRPATSEIGSIAASYMNISSAGDNDAIEAGGRTLYLLGVTQEAHNLATASRAGGSRHVPVPSDPEAPIPQIYDTGATSASSAVEEALKRKVREAAIIAQDELHSAPDASGLAKQVEFMDVQVPRLTLMAINREEAERQMLRFACLQWGVEPAADVVWKKKFDLETTFEDWLQIFDVAYKSNIVSPTLMKQGIRGIIKEKGINLDEAVLKQIDDEIDQAAEREAQGQDAGALFE